jgi:hypothetical protein
MRVLIFLILFPLPGLLFAQGGMIDSIRTKYDTISYWVKGGNAAVTFPADRTEKLECRW